jgi:hypothetical protein
MTWVRLPSKTRSGNPGHFKKLAGSLRTSRHRRRKEGFRRFAKQAGGNTQGKLLGAWRAVTAVTFRETARIQMSLHERSVQLEEGTVMGSHENMKKKAKQQKQDARKGRNTENPHEEGGHVGAAGRGSGGGRLHVHVVNNTHVVNGVGRHFCKCGKDMGKA